MKTKLLGLVSFIALSVMFTSELKAQNGKERLQMSDELIKQRENGTYGIEGLGTVKLKKGDLVDGQIVLNIGTVIGSQGTVQVFLPGKMSPVDFYPSMVEYVQIGKVIMYPIDVKVEMKSYTVFAPSLNASQDDKMLLFRAYSSEVSSQGNAHPYTLKKAFYLKMKSDKKASLTGALTLTPFHKSMSKDVEDCAALSKKIKDKEDGYKLVLIDLNGNNEDVYLRVMDEYNSCN